MNVLHPTYEDGSPMQLGDEVMVQCCLGCEDPETKPATLIAMRLHPTKGVWMTVEGEGFYSNEVIYDHETTTGSFVREKVAS